MWKSIQQFSRNFFLQTPYITFYFLYRNIDDCNEFRIILYVCPFCRKVVSNLIKVFFSHPPSLIFIYQQVLYVDRINSASNILLLKLLQLIHKNFSYNNLAENHCDKTCRRIFKLLMTAFHTLIIKENEKAPPTGRHSHNSNKKHCLVCLLLCAPRMKEK